jgi:hypothetical protein
VYDLIVMSIAFSFFFFFSIEEHHLKSCNNIERLYQSIKYLYKYYIIDEKNKKKTLEFDLKLFRWLFHANPTGVGKFFFLRPISISLTIWKIFIFSKFLIYFYLYFSNLLQNNQISNRN